MSYLAKNGKSDPPSCCWCGEANPSALRLCPACEQDAQRMRLENGLGLRIPKVLQEHEHADD